MSLLPSRDRLSALTRTISAVVPPLMVGTACLDERGRVPVLYSYATAFGVQLLDAADTPDVLRPGGPQSRRADTAQLTTHQHRPVEAHLLSVGVRHVVALPLGAEPSAALLWIGTANEVSDRELEALETLAAGASQMLTPEETPEEALARLRRLERAAALLPELQHVLDIRDVFDRLHATSRSVMPHETLALGLFSDDLSTTTLYAQTGFGGDAPLTQANPYPPATTRAWHLHVIDDIAALPFEADSKWAQLGMRSSLRLPIRSNERLLGGLNFMSSRPGAFSSVDTLVGQRIADYVALALSHHRLADDLRQAEIIRERATNLQALDGLLNTLTGSLDIREVFERVSAVLQQVVPHDMLALPLVSDDRESVVIYAAHDATGRQTSLPFPVAAPIPDTHKHLLEPGWDYLLYDDIQQDPAERDSPPGALGVRGLLRVAVRLERQVLGVLDIGSFAAGTYTRADALFGRRIADHIALTLSHHTLSEESRRAAALEERQAHLQMLDGMLDALSSVLDVREVFTRLSDIAQVSIAHDAMSISRVEHDTHVRVFAARGLGDQTELVMPLPSLAMLTEQWEYELIEDLATSRFVSARAGLQAGMRSVLIVPVRLQGRLHGSVNFFSRQNQRFSRPDVVVARKIADHIALTLAHQQLADEARRTEELKARAANLEMLDHLLQDVTDTDDLGSSFDTVSGLARKVIAHDAMVLPVLLPDGKRVRYYASTGPGTQKFPESIEIPEHLRRSDWDYEITEDLQVPPIDRRYAATQLGYRAALRVPIRVDGTIVAGLGLFSFTPGLYRQQDVIVARRIADRLALSLVRQRGLAASRRADEATERASRLEARVLELTNELDARTGYRRVVGTSQHWKQVLTQATQVAATETTVLLLGESGTGKEVIARFLHRGSVRTSGPFIALNCAALPEQLLEAELFGYERGAFTGATQSKPGQLEQAAGGTLFLDEVGEMSPPAQAKFLRVLQEREFQRLGGTRVLRTDARIVAATNRDLLQAINQGRFREDLYYRLNVFAIHLPPLRERRDDVLPLSDAFLIEVGRGLVRPPAGISRDARALLVDYNWPGNVRELRNVLERAAILCDGGLITAEHLALSVPAPPVVHPRLPEPAGPPLPPAAATAAGAARPSSADDLKSMERAMIEEALAKTRFNKSKAAKVLGLTRQQLYVRMRRYNLE